MVFTKVFNCLKYNRIIDKKSLGKEKNTQRLSQCFNMGQLGLGQCDFRLQTQI